MHIQTSKEALVPPLAVVGGAADMRGTIPIFGTTLLKTVGGRLSLLCFDGAVLARALADCKVQQDGELVVDARRFGDLIRSMPEKQAITMTVDRDQLLLTAGRSKFRLPMQASSVYPKKVPEDGNLTVTIGAKRLAGMFETVSGAMAVNDARVALNGTLLSLRDGALWAVATDAARMTVDCQPIEGSARVSPTQLIVPRKAALLAKKLLMATDGDATLVFCKTELRIQLPNDTVMVTKCIDATFPDWKRILPQMVCQASIAGGKVRETLAMMQVAISGFIDDSKTKKAKAVQALRRVTLTFAKKALAISHSDLATAELPAESPDSSNEQVNVRVDFLAEAANLFSGDLRIGYDASDKPISIRPANEDWPLAIVMPLRS